MSNFSYSKNFDGIMDAFMRRGSYYQPLLGFLQNTMIEKSELSKIERELIAAYVSNLNDCQFCVQAHQSIIKELGGDEQLLNTMTLAREDIQGISDQVRLLLGFVEKITNNSHAISQDEDIVLLKNAGINEETIEDAANVACLFNMINRLVDVFGVTGSDTHFEMVGKVVASQGYAAK